MPIYRAYLIGRDGHIFKRIDLECDDDAAAKGQARSLVNGCDVELWDGARRIAKFKH